VAFYSLGTALALLAAASSTAPASAGPSVQVHEYRIAYEANAEIDLGVMLRGQAAAGTTSYTFAEALPGRLLERRQGRAVVLVRVADAAMRMVINGVDQVADCDRARAAMARGFLVHLGSDGQVTGVQIDAGTPRLAADLIRSLAATIQVVRVKSGPPSTDQWTAEERDPAGVYIAHYAASASASGEVVIIKTKLRYLPANTPGAARVIPGRRTAVQQVTPDTSVSIHLDARTLLPTLIDATERLTTTVDGQQVGHGNTRLQLIARSAKPASGQAMRAIAATLAASPLLPLYVQPDPDAEEASIQRTALGDSDSTTLLAQLIAAGEDQTALDAIYLKLKALAYLHPEADVALATALLDAEPNSHRFEVLTRSLAAVGDAPAQAALADVIRKRAGEPMAVAGLAPALAGAPAPTQYAEATLHALIASADPVVAEQGMLGLGGMAQQLARSEPERSRAIVAVLVEQLGFSRTDARKAAALEALGNTGSSQIGTPALAALADRSPIVRISALHALRSLGTMEVETKLLEAVTADTNSQVRYAAAFSLGFGAQGAAVRAAEFAAFKVEPDDYVRGALLANLGHAAGSDAQIRNLIADAAVHDASEHVRIKAAELMSQFPLSAAQPATK
jgi:HEAT repeat protein